MAAHDRARRAAPHRATVKRSQPTSCNGSEKLGGGIVTCSKLSRHLVLAALACGLAQPAAAQEAPIRLGYLTVKTGPLAAGGRQMDEGLALFLKERGNTLGGRRVQLVTADTRGP